VGTQGDGTGVEKRRDRTTVGRGVGKFLNDKRKKWSTGGKDIGGRGGRTWERTRGGKKGKSGGGFAAKRQKKKSGGSTRLKVKKNQGGGKKSWNGRGGGELLTIYPDGEKEGGNKASSQKKGEKSRKKGDEHQKTQKGSDWAKEKR